MLSAVEDKLINSNKIVLPLWLRDTYATVGNEGIFNFTVDPEEVSESDILESYLEGIPNSTLFMISTDMYKYLNKHRDIFDQTITIVIRSLRDLYWNNRGILTREEISLIELAMTKPLPTFVDIFKYRKLEKIAETAEIPIFQMFGTITPYSIIHISVRDYIGAINNNMPIQIDLIDTNMSIELFFTPDDFWDFSEQKLITHINI